MKYKLIILDLDNTIFDFTKAETVALEQTLRFFRIPITDNLKNSYYEINSKFWKDFENKIIEVNEIKNMRFLNFCQVNDLNVDAKKMSRLYLENLAKTNFLIDGSLELLEKLSQQYLLSVITNGISFVQKARLENTKIRKYFKSIVISEDVGVSKPNPEIFDILLKNFKNIRKSSILMIGDGLSSDIAGANNAGIDSCWYNPNKITGNISIKPVYTVSNYSEIEKILNEV